MLYESPADFCAKYAKAHSHDKDDGFGQTSTLGEVTVVSETSDTARVEVLWHTFGHAPDAGYYEVFERTAFVLVKRHDGWRLHSEDNLGYEW
jgi:ketosteroid isomerase-like protein